jgi:hypothetical protein
MPSARVVDAKNPLAIADQGKGRRTCLFVVKDVHKATGQDIDAQAD